MKFHYQHRPADNVVRFVIQTHRQHTYSGNKCRSMESSVLRLCRAVLLSVPILVLSTGLFAANTFSKPDVLLTYTVLQTDSIKWPEKPLHTIPTTELSYLPYNIKWPGTTGQAFIPGNRSIILPYFKPASALLQPGDFLYKNTSLRNHADVSIYDIFYKSTSLYNPLKENHPAGTYMPGEQLYPRKDSIPVVSSRKTWIVAGAHIITWGAAFTGLNVIWYADYPRSSFHFYNDMKEWQQMDKAGHAWTAYQQSRLSAATWRWAGYSREKAAWLGGISGMAFQAIVEIQDGFSSEWGFSAGDIAANAIGAIAFTAQELTWKEQKISIKLSYNGYPYPNDLKDRRNELFGSSFTERLFKDYNSQAYWLSAPVALFVPSAENKLPWLSIALGYRAKGMFGGYENIWKDKSTGNITDRTDILRSREILISPDIDFTRIPSRKKWVRSLLFLANSIKFPFPSLRWNNKEGFSAGF